MSIPPGSPLPTACSAWFLATHLLLPFLLLAGVAFVLETSGVDLRLADGWFAWEGGSWTLRHHWLTAELIHDRGRQLVAAVALVTGVLLLVSRWVEPLLRARRALAYLMVCLIVLPGAAALLKRFSMVPCPWNLERYGGALPYLHNLQYPLSWDGGGNCFPAGHASGGYALLALYFAVRGRVRRPWLFLLPGLALGAVFGFGQQARGAHFLSHDLWTLSLCWFGALLLFVLMRPDGRGPSP